MAELVKPSPVKLQYITPECCDGARVKFLIIGQAGVGKTSLLRTIPEDERVCTVSAEGGLLSVRDLLKAKKVNGVVINEYNELFAVLKHLQTDWQSKFDWVFIDSLSEISAMCYSFYHNKYVDKDNNWGLWQNYYEALSKLVRKFRDLPKYNLVFTCLLASEVVKEKTIFAPDVTGGDMKRKLPSFFDEVFYMMVDPVSKDKKRVVKTSIGQYPGKDRSGKLNDTEPAHLGQLRDKILGLNQ